MALPKTLATHCLLLALVWSLPLAAVQLSQVPTLGAQLPVVASLAADAQAQAQSDRPKRQKRKTRRMPTVKSSTYEALEKAQLMIDPESIPRKEGEAAPKAKGTPRDAVEFLRDFLRDDINDYERALAWNVLAFAYYTLEDIPKTIDAYHKVLDQSAITPQLELSSIRAIFQLYYAEENFDKAFEYMDWWTEANGQEDPDVEYIRATAYYQLDDKEKAMELALKTERLAREQDREMKENWLYLQVVLYNEEGNQEKVQTLLEELAARYPKKRYFTHLASIYSEKELEDKALSIYAAAYIQDFLDKESEILALSQRLISQDNPFEATRVLEKGFAAELVEKNEKNIRLLASAYSMARETESAIEAWQEATEYAEDGEVFYRLGQALSNEDRHEEAVEAYEAALDKGELRDEAGVSFWYGISLMQLERWDEATKAFRKAGEMDENKADQSFRYVKYITQERKRLEKLAKALDAQTLEIRPRWQLY